MTLTELARAYVAARISLIWEFSGNSEASFAALREQVETEINPLLTSYDAAPVPPDDIPSSEDDDDAP